MNQFEKIDLAPARQEAAELVQDELKQQIATLNQQIKDVKPVKAPKPTPAKTTSTPLPAGAAIDTSDASAKKSKPAGASRKAKTTEQEAISGIAAAMQSIEAEPTSASLEGSEAAAIAESNDVKVGQAVEIQFGRHFGKKGTVTDIVGDNMFDVRIDNCLKVRLSRKQFIKVFA